MNAIKKYMSDYHLEALLDECKERNMSLDEYLVVYLLAKHGHEFWNHVENLGLKHFFDCSDKSLELDTLLRN